MRNWLIKMLGGFTRKEYHELWQQKKAALKTATSLMWEIEHQTEKVFGSARSLYLQSNYSTDHACDRARALSDYVYSLKSGGKQ